MRMPAGRWLSIGMMCGSFSVGLTAGCHSSVPVKAQPASGIIRAQRVEIVDDAGRTRIVLGPEDVTTVGGKQYFAGNQGVVIFDEGGKRRASLTLNSLGPTAELYGRDGAAAVSLGVNQAWPDDRNQDSAALMFAENSKANRMVLGIRPDGGAEFTWYDRNNVARMGIFQDASGQANLTLFDDKATPRAVLGSTTLEAVTTGGTEETAPSSLVLFDKAGKLMFRAPFR